MESGRDMVLILGSATWEWGIGPGAVVMDLECDAVENVDLEDGHDENHYKLESVHRVLSYLHALEEMSGVTKLAKHHEMHVQTGVVEEYESVVLGDNYSLLDTLELYLLRVNIHVDHTHLVAARHIFLALLVAVNVGDNVQEV